MNIAADAGTAALTRSSDDGGGPWADAVVGVLAATLLLAAAIGVPHERMLQDTLKSSLVVLGTLTASAVLLWQQGRSGQGWRWHPVLALPLLLLFYALASMGWSHRYLAGVEAVRWFVLALLMWVGLHSLSLARLPMLAQGIHGGAVLAAMWAALQFWWDLSWFPQAAAPASTFVNRNFLAEWLLCALPFSLLLTAQARGYAQIAWRSWGCAFSVVVLLMTGTRAALLGLLLVLPVLFWALLRYRHSLAWGHWRRSHAMLAGLIALGTLWGLSAIAPGNPMLYAERQGQRSAEWSWGRLRALGQPSEYTQGSASVRLTLWRDSARLIAAHPLTGVGAGAWEVAIPRYQTQDRALETDYYAHNETLQLLAEYGLLGGAVGVALLVYLTRAAWVTWRLRHRVDQAEGPWRVTALAAVAALLLVSQLGFALRLACTGALWALCLGLLAASDLRLAQHVPTPQPWVAQARQLGLLGVAVALVLALWGIGRAAASEARLVGALQMALGINRSPDPMDPRHDARKAEVLQRARAGIALHPHYRKLTPLIGDELARWGDWVHAREIWLSVLASRPHVVALMTNVALSYLQTGELAQAQVYLERAQAIQPRSPLVHSTELLLLERDGQWAQARQRSRTYLQSGEVDLNLLDTIYAVGLRRADLALAMEALQQRRRWPGMEADSWLKLGRLYAATHDDHQAQQAFDAALAATPPAWRDALVLQVSQPYRARLPLPR